MNISKQIFFDFQISSFIRNINKTFLRKDRENSDNFEFSEA